MKGRKSAYSSIARAESVQLRLGVVLKHLLGNLAGSHEALHDVNGNVPELLVLLLEQEDHTGGLSVEGAGDVQDGILNDALNGLVGNRALGLEAVVCAPGLDQLQQSGGGGVLEFGLSRAHFVWMYRGESELSGDVDDLIDGD
jgi:hypothetical protein